MLNIYLQIADQEVSGLKKDMEELESVRKSLAEFFCEDPGAFKLEECFKIFHGFCNKFKQAVIENERRRVQEEQAAARRKQREELAAKRKTCKNITFTTKNEVKYSYAIYPTDFLIIFSGNTGIERLRIRMQYC